MLLGRPLERSAYVSGKSLQTLKLAVSALGAFSNNWKDGASEEGRTSMKVGRRDPLLRSSQQPATLHN
jgi:hypothetical protein